MSQKKRIIKVTAIWLSVFVVIALFYMGGVRMSTLSRDPAQQMHEEWYIGFISNLGIILWAISAGVMLFSATVLRRIYVKSRARKFLMMTGVLALILLVDDCYLLHDIVFPEVLGLWDKLFYLFYAVYMVVYFWNYAPFIYRETTWGLLAAAYFFFGLSVVMDLNILPGGIDVEDLFKIFGICAFCYYALSTSAKQLTAAYDVDIYEEHHM